MVSVATIGIKPSVSWLIIWVYY